MQARQCGPRPGHTVEAPEEDASPGALASVLSSPSLPSLLDGAAASTALRDTASDLAATAQKALDTLQSLPTPQVALAKEIENFLRQDAQLVTEPEAIMRRQRRPGPETPRVGAVHHTPDSPSSPAPAKD